MRVLQCLRRDAGDFNSGGRFTTVTYNNVTIVTDSRSAITSITKYDNKHRIINKILDIMQIINKLFIWCWVPSHSGVAANEKVDKAAR